ncbi:MAG TPA: Holliday junction branch migration DNA helicase RuvB [Thermomicrobiales bacterium]|nr:Holliday junction branch migration DNA helicase RuvB [Chloroflexota bacterium]HQX63437.1 Holliday junction branch migration DNA helicase RuvB [Thermomicrobiales bacterium]HQZ88755.1 Holliday junction branch migration DNA helicase RuvB [Thermomicrobiales bacterium]HRA30968.1 Holliday junction branch migration DNA helicase RuvB [Thermomicrobiales bacterium]
MTGRVVSGKHRDEDAAIETSLRPRRLADYIGQDKVKDTLSIFIEAALARGEPLDHVLLYGPPGLGKTTLSNIIAAEMGVGVKITSGPAIERAGDLVSILTNIKAGDVLFIDEIHRLNRTVEEVLYPAMEDFAVDIIIGKGPGARSMRLNLPRFTLVGATTRLALLTSPLRDRFGSVFRLDFYDDRAMTQIVTRSARILDVEILGDGATEIARRSRGTPRVANRLLKRVRDFAQVRASGVITEEVARDAMSLLDVDQLGLDDVDRRILLAIIEKFDGGPVGVDTLAAATSEETDTIMDVYEPYLIQLGFLQRTPRGRVATRHAYLHLGLPAPTLSDDARQALLFSREPDNE